MELPSRAPEHEETFVARFRDADGEGLLDAISAAVAARRMSLAGRLVGLLEDDDVDDPDVAKARRAMGLLLHQGQRPEDVSWSALDDALHELRRARMHRIRRRMRRNLDSNDRGHRRSDRLGKRRR